MTCLFFAVAILGMRRLRRWERRGKRSGLFLVRSVPALAALMFVLRLGASPLHLYTKFAFTPWSPYYTKTPTVGRQVLSELKEQSGRDLVLVRYANDLYDLDRHKGTAWPPDGVWEWVYNSADIENQRVVWAHDMGQEKNQELIDYYRNRRVWLLYADDQPPKLVPYGSAEGLSAEQKKDEKGVARSDKMMHK